MFPYANVVVRAWMYGLQIKNLFEESVRYYNDTTSPNRGEFLHVSGTISNCSLKMDVKTEGTIRRVFNCQVCESNMICRSQAVRAWPTSISVTHSASTEGWTHFDSMSCIKLACLRSLPTEAAISNSCKPSRKTALVSCHAFFRIITYLKRGGPKISIVT